MVGGGRPLLPELLVIRPPMERNRRFWTDFARTLIHRSGSLWKSLIAIFSMLHLVCGRNSPLIIASLVRYSLLHFHLYGCSSSSPSSLSPLSSSLSFWTLRLRSSANPFLHRPFLLLPDWFHGLAGHLSFYSVQRLDLFTWYVRLSWLLVGFRTHIKSMHFHFISKVIFKSFIYAIEKLLFIYWHHVTALLICGQSQLI